MRHFQLIVDNTKVSQSPTEKQIGLVLDNRLSFEERLTAMGAKVSKTIASCVSFNIYKAFICLYLERRYIIYNDVFKTSFNQNIESIQYNACIAITGAGSSRG